MPPDLPAATMTYSGRAWAKKSSTAPASVRSGSSGAAPTRAASVARRRSSRAAPSSVWPPATNTQAPRGSVVVSCGIAGFPEGDGGRVEACVLGLPVVDAGVRENNLAAGPVELERNVNQVAERADDGGVRVGRGEQQQETAAAGTGQLAADSA